MGLTEYEIALTAENYVRLRVSKRARARRDQFHGAIRGGGSVGYCLSGYAIMQRTRRRAIATTASMDGESCAPL